MDRDLTDQERQELVELLTHAIEFTSLPVSPRVERLGRIRAKLSRGERNAGQAPRPHRRER